MTDCVLDASVAAAWFLPDEASALTEAMLEHTAMADVWVPALWLLEIGNLLLTAQRRGRIDAAKRVEMAGWATRLNIRVDREPVSIATLDALAARHGLTAYDAAYLELALRRALPLVTLDSALLAAMPAAGVRSINLAAR